MAADDPTTTDLKNVALPRAQLVQVGARWLLWGSGVLVFALIAASLLQRHEVPLDATVQAWLRSAQSEGLTAFMTAVTHLGDAEVQTLVAVAVVLALTWRKHWRSAGFVACVASGSAIMNHLLKMLFARARPDLALVHASGFAFPSGHSMGTAAIYGAIAIMAMARFPRARVPIAAACVATVFLVGLSRAYLYVHYPSDVIGGWALGATWPLWLKPVILGPGFRPETAADADLAADNFPPRRPSA